MKKFIAEILAAPIPNKMARNRYRGLFRYGICNLIRLKKLIKSNRSKPEHYLSVCAIAKNEGAYFKEWIDWHHALGVEKFYIYDNGSDDDTREVLNPYIKSGLVDYTFFPGLRRQLAAYDDCMERHRFASRWIAIIDLDEFIVPVREGSIPAFLKRCEAFAAVEINWLVYGSSGQKEKKPGGVMERFRFHAKADHPLNRMVKSIVDPRRVCSMTGCHEAARISGRACDSHLLPVKKHFRDRPAQHDVIRINHYAVKSYEEFLGKKARGRARGRVRHRTEEYFYQYDLNDIEDEQTYE
ncbi:MAG: glycosyltransferase family 92 protein [Prevotella sp.]|nr:glycosyltransferase family 92 protein [Prevotella sp.]